MADGLGCDLLCFLHGVAVVNKEPAFPSSNSPDTGYYAEGMLLRDYFAAHMLPALMSEHALEAIRAVVQEGEGNAYTCAAKVAYAYADAMLKVREEK